jgi:transcriptional regulator GlxA family with amidase domain
MDYVARVRTQAAIFMLRETGDKVSTIARRLGFYDGPHLAMTLRRRGLGRPSDYRPPVR